MFLDGSLTTLSASLFLTKLPFPLVLDINPIASSSVKARLEVIRLTLYFSDNSNSVGN
jgi:hypothetical protein